MIAHDGSDAACHQCLARAWLLARLAGHLDQVRDRVCELLALSDPDLIAAVGGEQRRTIEYERETFDSGQTRQRAAAAGLELLCRCRPVYPAGLRELAAPPAVLHIVGGVDRFVALLSEPAVAIVGARRPSPYGVTVARSLGRGLGATGVTVVSGMARGIDSAAHSGALDAVIAATPGAPSAGAPTIAVLGGAAEIPYPASARNLHGRIGAAGAIVSELPPGTTARRWMFPARNRIIAALSAMTVVVEARERSGALLTADHAAGLSRPLGAVPGHVTSPLTWGPHALLRAGARLVAGPQDVLEGVFGPDAPEPAAARNRARGGGQPALEPRLQALLDALAEGHATATALVHAGLDADDGLAALAALELGGRIRREAGGRYAVLAR